MSLLGRGSEPLHERSFVVIEANNTIESRMRYLADCGDGTHAISLGPDCIIKADSLAINRLIGQLQCINKRITHPTPDQTLELER